MPRVPVYERQVAVPDLRMDPAIAGQQGETVRRAGLAVAQFAGDAAARFEEAARAQRLVVAQARMTRELNDLRDGFEADTDWSSMPDRFDERAGKLFDGYRRELENDPVVLRMLETDFVRTVTRERVGVQKLARTRQVEAGKADLETALDTYAQVLAKEPDEFVQAETMGRARAAIEGLAAAGLIGADDARKREQSFFGRIREQKAQALIAADPETAVSRLLDPTDKDFGEMDPLARERATRAAQTRVDQLSRAATVAAEKAEREADKRLRETEERTGDAAFTLLRDGKLTREWLDGNRRGLSSSDYRALLREMSADKAARDDGAAVQDLTREIDRLAPDEFERRASRAVDGGLLKVETYRSMTEQNRRYMREDKPASPFKSGRELISATLDPGAIFQGSAASIGRSAQAQALVEWDNWADANPKATRAAALDEAQNILRRYQVIRFDQLSLALGVPRFVDGGREALTLPKLDAAETRLLREFEAGRLTQAQLEQENRKIEGWRQVLANRPAPTPQPGRNR